MYGRSLVNTALKSATRVGPVFFATTVHRLANPSLGSYMSLLVMVDVIHLTTHIYKNCSKWPPPASIHPLSLRSMLCCTLWKSPGVFRIWSNPFCIRSLRTSILGTGVEYTKDFKCPHFSESKAKHETQGQAMHRSRRRSLWTISVNVCC